MKKITGEELGALLFYIHEHYSEIRGGPIIYFEKDLLKVLKAIGLPEPIWGESMTIKEWKDKDKKK